MALNQQMSGWKFKEFARVDNITNRTYVGSVIIGDANGRYYETAPPRNTMIGASATYQF
jgi:iron complex outermembrane receptor protein